MPIPDPAAAPGLPFAEPTLLDAEDALDDARQLVICARDAAAYRLSLESTAIEHVLDMAIKQIWSAREIVHQERGAPDETEGAES